MKALYFLGALTLTSCTNIDGKYVAICDRPVASNPQIAVNNANTNTANTVYTQASYTPQGTGHSYIVRKGDSIYAIARKFGLSPASILARNATMNANTLKIGSLLYLPIQ